MKNILEKMIYAAASCAMLIAVVLTSSSSGVAQNHNPEFSVSNLNFDGSNYILIGEDDEEAYDPRTKLVLKYREGEPEKGDVKLEWVTEQDIEDGSSRVLANDSESGTDGFTDGNGNTSTSGPWEWDEVNLGDYEDTEMFLQGVANDSFAGDVVKLQASHTETVDDYAKEFTLLKVALKKLEFTSDHNLICDGSDEETAGSRYQDVEWDPENTTPVNAPITHTAGDTEDDKITLTLTLEVGGVPANTQYTITGNSTESALDFSKTGTFSSGANVTVDLTATNPIGTEIQKIEKSITWTIEILGADISLGDTGDHVIFTTLGDPDDSAPSSSSVPNVPRMDIAVPAVSNAISAAGASASNASIVWEVVKAEGAYELGVSLDDAEAWTLPSLSGGADCLSIAKFVRNVCMTMGVPGSFDSKTFAAYYATAAESDRPEKAIVDLSLNSPSVNPGDEGAPALSGLDSSWILGLADQNCTRHDGTGSSGQVGCGPDGLNAFEAAVIYTDTSSNEWYFPGGTDLIYDDENNVVQIFQTMVWVGLGDHDSDPLTPDVSVVKAVDFEYTTPPNATP